MITRTGVLAAALTLAATNGLGQAPQGGPPSGPPQMPPITLTPDDKPAVPPPPAGFDAPREAIGHGRLEMVEYDSNTVGTKRKMLVYTPPGYSSKAKYPVLYLLHGIGGDETEWQQRRRAGIDPRQPHCREEGGADDRGHAERPRAEERPGRGRCFSPPRRPSRYSREDLLNDVIPFVESRYSVVKRSRITVRLPAFRWEAASP